MTTGHHQGISVQKYVRIKSAHFKAFCCVKHKTKGPGALCEPTKLQSILFAKTKLIWASGHALGELRTQHSQGESGKAEVSRGTPEQDMVEYFQHYFLLLDRSGIHLKPFQTARFLFM